MTTYWLIGEKPMGSNVQETITVSSAMTTVTSMTTTSNQVSIDQPRSHEDRANVATYQTVQSKSDEIQSKQNCQEQNHRAAQKGVQEQQRTQSNQQKGQEHRQQVGGQGGSLELQNRSKDRSGGDCGRGGGKEDGGGGGGGGGNRDWNDGSKDEGKVERQGGETFTKGNGLTSRARTISNGSSASPSRNHSLGSTSSINVSQGRRPYQASESVANHTESGSSAPLLVPTTPASRV